MSKAALLAMVQKVQAMCFLARQIWLTILGYTGATSTVLTTLQEGRLGKMPAFDDRRLDATQLKSTFTKLAK